MIQPSSDQFKKAKEISDIVSERDELRRLLSGGHWGELSDLLQKLNRKYMTETLVYNLANPNPPANLEENANNCIKFLNTLLTAKAADNPK